MKPYTPKEIQRYVRMRMAGWHPQDIANMADRSVSSISRLLSIEKTRNGLRYPKLMRRDATWTMWRIELLAREYGIKPYDHIAREHNLSKPRLSFLMAKRAQALRDGVWI